nr:hypothetical protein [Cardiobacterium valvarum]
MHTGVEFVVGDVFEVARFAAAAGGDEGFEGGDARFRQRFEVVVVPGQEAAHRGVVGVALVFGGFEFEIEAADVHRRRDGVQRHFDEGGGAAGNHSFGAGEVAFPFGAPRFGNVHVHVHHAGQDVVAGGIDGFCCCRVYLRRDAGDFAVLDGDVAAQAGVGQDEQAVCDEGVVHGGSPGGFRR